MADDFARGEGGQKISILINICCLCKLNIYAKWAIEHIHTHRQTHTHTQRAAYLIWRLATEITMQIN